VDSRDPLRDLLKGVSRSFFLTLAVVPRSMRRPLGVGYLLARAADTIADTGIVPAPDRLTYLDWFRDELDRPTPSRLRDIAAALTGPAPNPAERDLLTRLPECLAAFSALAPSDRDRLRQLLRTLIEGMRRDLETFGARHVSQAGRPGPIIALETREDLDRYTYFAAGCVGVYWTDMAMAHRSRLRAWDPTAMRRRGLLFGQALQMTNVLRDLAHDLRAGRCYLPRRDLLAHGLRPEELLDPRALARVRPLLRTLVQLTLAHYTEAWVYLAAIPVTEVRLRLACAWPLFIGLATIDLVQRAPNLLDPQVTLKISRSDVQRILARSAGLVWSNRGLGWYYGRHLSRIHAIGGLLG
jgi:farnesyl-diphosphate farnesyltransferase